MPAGLRPTVLLLALPLVVSAEAGDRHDPSGCGLLGGTDAADTDAATPGGTSPIGAADGVVGSTNETAEDGAVAAANGNAPEIAGLPAAVVVPAAGKVLAVLFDAPPKPKLNALADAPAPDDAAFADADDLVVALPNDPAPPKLNVPVAAVHAVAGAAGHDAAGAAARDAPVVPPNENPGAAGFAAIAAPNPNPLAGALAPEAAPPKLRPEDGAEGAAAVTPNPKLGVAGGALATEENPKAGAEDPLTAGAAAEPKAKPLEAAGVAAGVTVLPNPPNVEGAAAVVVAAGAPKLGADTALALKPPNAEAAKEALLLLVPAPKLKAPAAEATPPKPKDGAGAAPELKVVVAADPKAGAGTVPCLCLLAM